MKTYAIVIRDHPISEEGWKNLQLSSKYVQNDFEIERHNACTPTEADERLRAKEVVWNYPWIGEVHDIQTGLIKKAYQTVNPFARVACFFSHYDLWKKCIETDEAFLILEHDAIFMHRIDLGLFNNGDPMIIGINSPFRATRRAQEFDKIVKSNLEVLQAVPKIDNVYVPQGLAGNSAYMINPKAAQRVIDKVGEVGAWPNDALLCYQNFPFLSVTRTYYTFANQMGSTTSL